jgi:hypothetical protein
MEMDGGRGAADGADPRDGRWCYAIGGDGFGVDRASSLRRQTMYVNTCILTKSALKVFICIDTVEITSR